MTEQDESECVWSTLEAVKGELVKLSKSERTVTLEDEGETPDETTWTTYHVVDSFGDDDFEEASKLLGRMVQATVKDEQVVNIARA